jgi:hypothetical protein
MAPRPAGYSAADAGTGLTPALLTAPSRRPKVATVRSIKWLMAAGSVTSVGTGRALAPSSATSAATSSQSPARRPGHDHDAIVEPARVAQVDRRAALAAADHVAADPELVALGRLDLDDVGAQAGQELPRVRAG